MTTELLWNQFRAICQIPHPSGHVEALRQYIIGQVQKAGLVADADAAGNIRVELPASAGWEDKARRQGRSLADVTTLQAHIDMVPQADSDVDFDFLADGLRLRETDDLVMADGTTLGADNGIGVAAMLAIVADEALAKTLTHGPLELLFTVDEETGMEGASHLKPPWLKGTQLINLDTEREGDLMVGCAGAVDLNVTYRYKLERGIPEGARAVRITLGGLKGGHSGLDLQLGRGNACK
ncbi:MAG: M20/M25/M40 family metallo-hydrolase, partial [Bacteroidales bacterium]|nr:M20/M25/M40 family metallo-hydrolase [Bacteroidales bacterium]